MIVVFILINLFFGYLVYYVEFFEWNFFDNVFVGIWWVVVIMIIVGYGDVVFMWYFGCIVVILCVLIGIIILVMFVVIVIFNFIVYYIKLK